MLPIILIFFSAGYKKVKDWKVKLLVSEEVGSCFLLILFYSKREQVLFKMWYNIREKSIQQRSWTNKIF